MQKYKIWDGAVRFFHWSQLLLLGGLWYSAEQELYGIHMTLAYSLAAVLLARLVWALMGSDNARFSHFVRSPVALFRWLRTPGKPKPNGHNPASGYMVVLLLLLVLLQFITGLMTTDDVLTEGPLVAVVDSSWVALASSFHRLNLDILLVLISVHVLAALWHQWRGDKVISQLVTGKSEQPLTQPLRFKKFYWFLLLLLLFGFGFYSWQGEQLWLLLQADLAG